MYNFWTNRGGKSGYRKLNPIEGKKKGQKVHKRESKQEAQNNRSKHKCISNHNK